MLNENKKTNKQPLVAEKAKPLSPNGKQSRSLRPNGVNPRKQNNIRAHKELQNYSKQVSFLVGYFIALLLFSFWFLFDVWSNNFVLLRLIGVTAVALEEPLLRTIGFTITGGFLGSILYHIRVLFHYYAKRKYDPRWFGKYLTAPWEGASLAMVVLALIRGGVTVFGGSTGTDVTAASNFAAFGVGALVGFGMRDVVGWLGYLIQNMFTVRQPERHEDWENMDSKKNAVTYHHDSSIEK